VNLPPMAWTTVCSVYSGLVPRSPKTTPSEASLTHVARFLAVAGIELLVGTDPVFTAIPNSSQRRGEEQDYSRRGRFHQLLEKPEPAL
jgi:hypothetical protein